MNHLPGSRAGAWLGAGVPASGAGYCDTVGGNADGSGSCRHCVRDRQPAGRGL